MCLLFVIGGYLCVIPEPLLDQLVHCSFAPKNDLVFYHHRASGIPWFMLASYGAYNGGMSSLLTRNQLGRLRMHTYIDSKYIELYGLGFPHKEVSLMDDCFKA